ncbi:hypothetical protein COU76_05550 [Candidatus Peregrinibacteria bacterium CG10_big_fil_rev_8_21_14_0_10_49_10]|nr:MAG: hypothetical protein COU76_05550 [Candidatus Peregrinibacteria bacterium CG10_big_fil_rev_8_21_14_0_10_49_10]
MDIPQVHPIGQASNYEEVGTISHAAFSTEDSRLIREEINQDNAINVYAVGNDKVAVIYREFNKDGGYTCYRWLLNVDGSIAGYSHTLQKGEEVKVDVADVLNMVGLDRVTRELQTIWGISFNTQHTIREVLTNAEAA